MFKPLRHLQNFYMTVQLKLLIICILLAFLPITGKAIETVSIDKKLQWNDLSPEIPKSGISPDFIDAGAGDLEGVGVVVVVLLEDRLAHADREADAVVGLVVAVAVRSATRDGHGQDRRHLSRSAGRTDGGPQGLAGGAEKACHAGARGA